jgi:hypothetical protein
MHDLPFYDGRSFVRYLEGMVKLQGIRDYKNLVISVIGLNNYYGYLNNKHSPSLDKIVRDIKVIENILL